MFDGVITHSCPHCCTVAASLMCVITLINKVVINEADTKRLSCFPNYPGVAMETLGGLLVYFWFKGWMFKHTFEEDYGNPSEEKE